MNMMTHQLLPPNAEAANIARASGQALSQVADGHASLGLRISDSDHVEEIELPAGAVELLLEILKTMAAGQGITIIPVDAELTTMQAADILNVSRPYLVKLLDQKEIPFKKKGKHRRILLEDILSYKTKVKIKRKKILDELTAEAQKMKLGYD